MNLQEIKNGIVRQAQQKLSRHKNLGSQSNLSIKEVAELLDIVQGRTIDVPMGPEHFIGNYSLN
jgi:hypothetical protein